MPVEQNEKFEPCCTCTLMINGAPHAKHIMLKFPLTDIEITLYHNEDMIRETSLKELIGFFLDKQYED